MALGYPLLLEILNCDIKYVQDWPVNSPDLNPIENFWSIVKKKMCEKATSSVSKLKNAVVSVWENLSEDVIHNFVDSSPRRLHECIKKGNTTKW